jgi:hypothetical protein
MPETLTWDIARASGFVAYGLVTLAVALGLALSLRWQNRYWTRMVNTEIHQYLTVLAGVFTLLHGLMVFLDPFTKFTWAEVLIPGVSHYRPLWMAFGIVAAYLGAGVWLTVLLRPRIGYEWWRRLHGLAFVVWALATAHGLGDGSDTRTAWALAAYAASTALVLGLLLVRLLAPKGARARPRPALAAAVSAAFGLGAVLAVGGPLQPGWNRIANNGHGSGARIPLVLAQAASSPTLSPGYAAPFTGSVAVQPQEDGAALLQIAGTAAGRPPVALTIDLTVSGGEGGGLVLDGGAALIRTATGAAYQATLLSARGRTLLFVWSTGARTLEGALSLTLSGRAASGRFAVLAPGPANG